MYSYTASKERLTPFEQPVYVTRPMLGDLNDYIPYFKEIWDSSFLTNGGAKHQALEAALAQALQAPYVKLFNNGTIALLSAFHALELSGEVITTPFTFPATTHALVWNGITPVFGDIHPETLCLDPAKIESLITEKTTGILGVHVYGMPCDVDKIQKIADKHRLKVVYDGAHAFKTAIGGRSIGSYGDMTMFSFHATKLFHTMEGGALVFADPALAEKVDMLKNFGFRIVDGEMDVPVVGINGKMNEMQAAVGLVNLKLVDEERRKRAEVRAAYARCLSNINGISLFSIPGHITDSLQYIVIRVGPQCAITRDALQAALNTYNVYSRKYFYPLCSDYACYSHLKSRHLKVARQVAEEVLCLPLYGALSMDDVERIVDMIRFHAVPKTVTVSVPKTDRAAKVAVAQA